MYPEPPAPQKPAGGRTVLVAEDDRAILLLLAEIFRKQGDTVIIASNGADALQLAGLCQKPIDLLVTDFEMPFLNGIQLANEVRAIFPQIRVLLISGSHHRAGSAEIPLAFLKKPFTSVALLERVRALMAGS
jgi:DNA-binding response OmpR family regulator